MPIIFMIALFCLQCYMRVKCGLPQRKKKRGWIQYIGLWKDLCWELGVEQREGCDHRVLKTQVLLGQTCHKVHIQLVDPCSCWVVSKRPETTTQKVSMKIRKWNCQPILANMEKSGEIKNEIGVYIYIYIYIWRKLKNKVIQKWWIYNEGKLTLKCFSFNEPLSGL